MMDKVNEFSINMRRGLLTKSGVNGGEYCKKEIKSVISHQ